MRWKHELYPVAVTLTAAILVLPSCATTGKTLALGGAVGAGAGAIAGGLADPGKDGQNRTRNVLIGTAVGGVAGLVTGALVGGAVEEQKQEAFEKGKASSVSGTKSQPTPGGMPRLQEPKVEARWVDPQIVGNRFVDGHWEYQIVEPARWEAGQ